MALGLPDVSMPQRAAPSHHLAVAFKAFMEIVQECFERADIQNTQSIPVFGTNSRENGECGCLRFSPRGGSEEQTMLSGMYRPNTLLLERPEFAPPQRVDDVVLDERVELVESAQSSREMSSTDEAGIEFRSSVLSSSSRIVSL